MTTRLLNTAQILIYDPVASNGNMTRTCLLTLGYRKVDLVMSLGALESRMQLSSPDLLLCEMGAEEGGVCRFIQSIRQGLAGESPFPVVIVTTWRPDGPTISEVLKSGADDLVARPISASVLEARIKAQIEHRKLFAITSDYIGPDRRSDPNRTGTQCIAVPNPLLLRTRKGLSNEESERHIAEVIVRGKARLNLEKMQRDAVQLRAQWQRLEQRGAATPDIFDILRRMEGMSQGIKRRAATTQYVAACRQCDSIIGPVRKIFPTMGSETSGKPEAVADIEPLLQIVGRAALAIGQIFDTSASQDTSPTAQAVSR